LFIDGVEQTNTDGNPLGTGEFNSHSGDVVWGDPDTNLETGATDIAYAGINDAVFSDFATWSDNSQGDNAGALDKTTEIRDILFRRGALPDDTISSGTESAMQTSYDGTATTRPDWPLSFRIEAPTGGGDLNLTTDKEFNSRITDHLEWRGGGTLTMTNIGDGDLDSAKCWSQTGGTIVVRQAVTLTVKVVDIGDGSDIEDARVLVKASDGTGYLPFEDSVSITRSGSTATVTHTAHGLVTGDKVQIDGADQEEYNGAATITVTGVNAYTFTVSGSPTTPATGTIVSTGIVIEGNTDSNGEISDERFYSLD
jgi:hypothetical protein